MFKKILVTGSSGKEVVKQLKAINYEVIGIDIIPSPTTDVLIDILNQELLLEISSNVDAIIHTAALHGKHYDLNFSREDFIEVNIKGTNNLLNACITNNIKKFIYISTTSIYGEAMIDAAAAVWVTEDLTPKPRDIYDITKLTCELLCKDYFEKEDLETTVLRVSRFLPEEENLKAIHRLYRGLDESDGASAIILALEKSFSKFEIYNVSNLSPFTISNLKELKKCPKTVIQKYYPNIEDLLSRKGWVFPASIDRVYSIQKAINDLNYNPQNNFDYSYYNNF